MLLSTLCFPLSGSHIAKITDGGEEEIGGAMRSEHGDAETRKQVEASIKDLQLQEDGNRAVEENWSGSERSNEEWPLPPSPSHEPLQELVNACRAVLKDSSVPPTDDVVSFIRGAMGKITMFDVGLMDEIGFFYFRNSGPKDSAVITCKTIYKRSNFAVMVLYLPKGVAVPLHDQTATIVFSKILVGSARVKAFDWVLPRVCADGPAGPTTMTLAEKGREQVTVPNAGAWVLSADSGGHRLVAWQGGCCAFINVHVPLHAAAAEERRRFSFYRDLPYEAHQNVADVVKKKGEEGRLAWLHKIEVPKDVKIVSLPYLGPPIV